MTATLTSGAPRVVEAWLSGRPSGSSSPGGELADDLATVLFAWQTAGTHSPQTFERMGEVAIRFATRLGRSGRSTWSEVDEIDVIEFVEARTRIGPPATATMHFRRTTVRTVFRSLRELGFPLGDPTIDLSLPPRTCLRTRPLTDDEITLLRIAAVTTGSDRSRNATAVALAEATAVTSEIPLVTVGRIDDPAAPTRIALPGTRRYEARSGRLTSWGQSVLTRRLAAIGHQQLDQPLAYGGAAGPDDIAGQVSACNAIGVLLHATGLNREPDVRPNSIRHWAGRTLFDRGVPIQEVAVALGCRSLDATAEAIGLDWRPAS